MQVFKKSSLERDIEYLNSKSNKITVDLTWLIEWAWKKITRR